MTELKSVRQLMERTKTNHEYIRQEQLRGQDVYEVTQLLNSFLGAFAHPWEEWKKELSEISLDAAYDQGWPRVTPDDARDEAPRTLGDLLRLIRNALMHGNFSFYADEDDEIRSILLWNQRGEYRTWATRLDIATLRRFLECFEQHAESLPPPQQRQPPTRHIRDRPPLLRCERCQQVIQPKSPE